MRAEAAIAALSGLARGGVFASADAVDKAHVSRKQLASLASAGVIDRVLPGVYRLIAVPRSWQQWLRAAILWGGEDAAASGPSAGQVYGFEGVHADKPHIVVPSARRLRHDRVG